MAVTIVRHVPFEGPGYIEHALREEGFQAVLCDLFAGAPAPDVHQMDALVIMGGPMSANDDLRFLRKELILLEQAFRSNIPVLGVCLGSQLIAKALNARVYKNAVKEIGWYPIHWREEAKTDSVFRDLPNPAATFQWHGETFDLPSGATWLAWSDSCPHQAFRVGANTYGLQFHLEVTPEMISDWCQQDLNCGDVRELRTPIDPYAHAETQRELARVVFGRWAATVPQRAK